MHTCKHTHALRVCIYAYMYTCIYVDMYTHVYEYIYIYIYLYTHMHVCLVVRLFAQLQSGACCSLVLVSDSHIAYNSRTWCTGSWAFRAFQGFSTTYHARAGETPCSTTLSGLLLPTVWKLLYVVGPLEDDVFQSIGLRLQSPQNIL